MTKDNLEPGPEVHIDYFAICNKIWWRMGSDNYEPSHPNLNHEDPYINEELEFTSNMYCYFLYLYNRFQPSKMYICKDSKPYWRDEFYKQWYAKYSRVYRQPGEENKENFLIIVDQKWLLYSWHEPSEMYHKKKLVAKQISDIDWADWERIEGQEGRYEVLYDIIKEKKFTYKGTRSSSDWNKKFNTPKKDSLDQYGNFQAGADSIWNALAESLSGTFRAKILQAEGAEADDIMYHLSSRNKSGRDIIAVARDSDLHQIYLSNLFYRQFNPNEENGNPSMLGGLNCL